MKSFITAFALIACLIACQSNDVKNADLTKKAKDSANYTTIKWIDSLKDIGKVTAGKTAEITFKFLNSGDKPLYLIEAKPGCGCTLAEYPKQAILPGKEGIIKANYNVHKDGQGEFKKNIKVITNTKGKTDHFIFFYGTIQPDSTAAKTASK